MEEDEEKQDGGGRRKTRWRRMKMEEGEKEVSILQVEEYTFTASLIEGYISNHGTTFNFI